jgi:phosphonoacetaldehyde hydrolase
MIKAVLFDLIGTTVIEKDPAHLNGCFVRAFSDSGVEVSMETIRSNRGKDKQDMIRTILVEAGASPSLVEPVLESFRRYLLNSLDNFLENPGASLLFRQLKRSKVNVGIGSGLPRDIFEVILAHLNWDTAWFDYVGIAEELGKGRPDPVMILDMLSRLRLQPGELVKLGDTVADIMEGKNAGVITGVILSGTQDEDEFGEYHPDFMIRSLQELPAYINARQG